MNEDNKNSQQSLPEDSFGNEDTKEDQTPIDSIGSVVATKPADNSPPDGGVAAWLVVLGAWCCSLSSPGWINSMYLQFLHDVLLSQFPQNPVTKTDFNYNPSKPF